MKKTLAAIARDRRCQALMSLMRKGRDRILKSGENPSCPSEIATIEKQPENIFRDTI